MRPKIESISLVPDQNDFLLRCTFQVPIERSSDTYLLLKKVEPAGWTTNRVVFDQIHDVLTKRVFNADNETGYESAKKTMLKDPRPVLDDSKYNCISTAFGTARTNDCTGMEIAENNLSCKMTDNTCPDSAQDVKVEIQVPSTCSKTTSTIVNVPANYQDVIENKQLFTWFLSQQTRHAEHMNDNTENKTSRKSNTSTESALTDSSQNSYIDLVESFSNHPQMRIPISAASLESQNIAAASNEVRNLTRYYSSSSSSTGSEADSSLEDFFKEFDGESSQGGKRQPENEDELDIQALIEALSTPIEDYSVDTFNKILNEDNSALRSSKWAGLQEEESAISIKGSSIDCHIDTVLDDLGNQNLGLLDDDFDHFKKKTGPRRRPNQCYHLWDFLRDELGKANEYMEWVSEERKVFRILDTKKIANAWGEKKKSRNMNYDKLSRSLRYYCKLNILEKVPGKRLHFRFGDGKMWTKV